LQQTGFRDMINYGGQMNNNLNDSAKDNAIKSVFVNNNSANTNPNTDQKERIEYQPSQMTEAEEFFGPQKGPRPDSLNQPNPTIKSFSDSSLQAQAQGAMETTADQEPTSNMVDNDNNPNHEHIEVQHYDVPTKKSLEDFTEPEDQPVSNNSSFKPIKLHDDNHAVGIATTVALIVLSLGFGGGYFGYHLSGNFLKNQMVSADEDTKIVTPVPTLSTSPSAEPSPSASVTTSATADWSVYKNTKYNYSVKYPDTWYGQGTNNEQSVSVQLTSFKPSTTGSEIQKGYKIEVMFQDAKGKLLKDWIETNNALTGNTSKLTTLKIDGKDAYQQTIESVGKSINTYVFQADKIMVISYYAGETDFDAGKTIYQQIIESIKLL